MKELREDAGLEEHSGIKGRYIEHLKENQHKKAILITSRVHPGETQASSSLEGIADFFLSDCEEAKCLR